MRELTLVRCAKGLLTVLATALWTTAALADDDKRVIAVNQALAFFAERLLGDSAQVSFPVPKGVDPSFWRPSISDISAVQSADLILLNGAGFATWIDRVSLPRSRLVNTTAGLKDQFIVTESITHSHGEGGEHSHEGIASYTWLDPMLAIGQAEAIATAIIARDIAPKDDIDERLGALASELTELDQKARNSLVDLKGVEIIATHPRYQYFARRYGLSVTSLEWEPGAMPSKDQLDDLEQLVVNRDARILIWEAQPPANALEITAALGLRNVIFEPGARSGLENSFIATYAAAVSALSQAATQSSN